MQFILYFCSMFYFVKTPKWLQWLFPTMIWEMSALDKKIYLTFDDGPHPEHTIFVLDELKKYNAKATFFCIGNNVKLYPAVFKRIIDEGHSIGNHTFHHLNGKKSNDTEYINDIAEAAKYIDSNLFRPPYGRIKKFQSKLLQTMAKPYKIVMWTVLSGDFDNGITKERCLENVLFKTNNGAIVLFHDSEKAAEKMRYALPAVLHAFNEKGFLFEKIAITDCI
jgi:peptidoglycan-N-acetylglucosamine deacetylase